MTDIIALLAPGAMGAAVGARLVGNGAVVRTCLDGRGGDSARRAAGAGLTLCADDRSLLDGASLVLSIVPPGVARAVAERLARTLKDVAAKPVVVDCNAVSPMLVGEIAAIITGSGAAFVDGAIIGGPPRSGKPGPLFYVSGERAADVLRLVPLGLRVAVLPGPVGAASALKMSYAGLTKGLTALGTAMILGATRGGAAAALKAELADSQPQILAYLERGVPDMFAKAYRWVAEMEEIAGFLEGDPAAQKIYAGMAELYARIAGAGSPEGTGEVATLARFFEPPGDEITPLRQGDGSVEMRDLGARP